MMGRASYRTPGRPGPVRVLRRASASGWARSWRKTLSQEARGPAARICPASRSRNWPRYSREARSFPSLAMPAATSASIQSASARVLIGHRQAGRAGTFPAAVVGVGGQAGLWGDGDPLVVAVAVRGPAVLLGPVIQPQHMAVAAAERGRAGVVARGRDWVGDPDRHAALDDAQAFIAGRGGDGGGVVRDEPHAGHARLAYQLGSLAWR